MFKTRKRLLLAAVTVLAVSFAILVYQAFFTGRSEELFSGARYVSEAGHVR